jgi:DNA polymerase kappa
LFWLLFWHWLLVLLHQAGMGSVDKAKVAAVVHAVSRGSAFYAHAAAQAAKTDARIAKQRQHLATLSAEGFPSLMASRRNALCAKAAALEQSLDASRFCGRPCVVVDMDMFFAAVEVRKQVLPRGSCVTRPLCLGPVPAPSIWRCSF